MKDEGWSLRYTTPAATLLSICVCLGVACGSDENGNPTAPTSTPTLASVTVTFSRGGTIFIGDAVQFEARESLSDGTTRVAINAMWGSDTPAVATVSSTGLVTAVAAGQATIVADVGALGTMLIRVFPPFGATWTGSEVVTSCEESGVFVGLVCIPEAYGVGTVFPFRATFAQDDASVNAEIDFGEGFTSTMTGNIAIGGELRLPTAPVLPAEPPVDIQSQNWQSRADTPPRMTGTYEWFFTAPGLVGSARQVSRLQDVTLLRPRVFLDT